jgi:hydroxymethylglutaryl-CoA synthase
MRLSRLVERYSRSNPKLGGFLARAVQKTGQISLRFPDGWEDAVTMAAQAATRVLQRMSDQSIRALRYIAVGTESSLDMSKPIASHVGGLLRAAGFPIPETIATFQTQHACASGTMSLLGVNALIARYASGTSAEVTQGAGAVAMVIEQESGLVELDTPSAGYASRDVDDFFRPVGAKTPRVRGAFSISCYKETIEQAFLDHCHQLERDPADVLRETQLFAFHAPYRQLPRDTITMLAGKYLGLDEAGCEEFLRSRDFDAAIEAAALCGNMYSGSLFLGLTALLSHRFAKRGAAIVGEKVLLFSYGSGNVAVVLAGTVAPRAPQIMSGWDVDSDINHAQEAKLSEYDAWMTGETDYAELSDRHSSTIPAAAFYLSGVRADGYRLYEQKG